MEFYNPPLQVSSRYERYIKMGLDEIPERDKYTKKICFPDGSAINMKSIRMKMFLIHKKTRCVCCGLNTSFAAVESVPHVADQKHLNFYGIDDTGKEVLMTWDHIQPKSKGGKNTQENSQCLCETCNGLKGNSKTFDEVRAIRKERGMTEYFYAPDEKAIPSGTGIRTSDDKVAEAVPTKKPRLPKPYEIISHGRCGGDVHGYIEVWEIDELRYGLWNTLKKRLEVPTEKVGKPHIPDITATPFDYNKPHYNVMFSGGFDSMALVIDHLEKGEHVVPFYVGFSETPLQAELCIDILRSIYGGDKIDRMHQLFSTVMCNGAENPNFSQQSFVAFYASRISEYYLDSCIATEIAFCRNDDALSYLDELRSLYNSSLECTYHSYRPPLLFPGIKALHYNNVKAVMDKSKSVGIPFPATCLDADSGFVDAFKGKDNATWIYISQLPDRDTLNKPNKCMGSFKVHNFIIKVKTECSVKL